MPKHVYRGVAASSPPIEFTRGEIVGVEVTIYSGEFEHVPDDVDRGAHVSDLPWFTPDESIPPEDRYMTDTVGVTGGITHVLSTAIQFGGLVLYLDDSRVDATPINYRDSWFDGYEGALAWVAGNRIRGEVRTIDGDVVGTTDGDGIIDTFGEDDISMLSMTFSDEYEAIAGGSSIDVDRALDSVATFVPSRPAVRNTLSNYDGYTTRGLRSRSRDPDDMNVSEWDDERTAVELRDVIADEAAVPTDDYWLIVLNAAIHDVHHEIKADWFEFAVGPDGVGRVDEYDDVPQHLLGY